MTVSDQDFQKLRAELNAAVSTVNGLRSRIQLLESESSVVRASLNGGVVVPLTTDPVSPTIPQGYAAVVVNGHVRLADAAGLALVTRPSGVVISTTHPGEPAYLAVSGVRPAIETGLGAGAPCSVGINDTGRLVRTTDPSYLLGTYLGECNAVGDLTLGGGAPSSSQQAVNQPFWHLDPVNGNDLWDGTAATHTPNSLTGPVKTAREIMNRIGLPMRMPITSRIFLHNNLPANDPLICNVLPVSSTGAIVLEGVPKVVTTGHLTSFVMLDHDAVGEKGCHLTANIDLSPYVGKKLRLTSGTRANSSFIDILANLGGGVFRTSVCTYWDETEDMNNAWFIVPAGNETFEVIDLPVMAGGGFYSSITEADPNAVGPPPILVGYVALDPSVSTIRATGPNIVFHHCEIVGPAFGVTFEQASVSWLAGFVGSGGAFICGVNCFTYYQFGSAINAMHALAGAIVFNDYPVWQNPLPFLYGFLSAFNLSIHSRGLQIFGAADTVLVFGDHSTVYLGGKISGSGNTGPAFKIGNAAVVTFNKAIFATDTMGFTSFMEIGGDDIGPRTALPAIDANGNRIAGMRNLTFANMIAPVGSGGFDYIISDPWGGSLWCPRRTAF